MPGIAFFTLHYLFSPLRTLASICSRHILSYRNIMAFLLKCFVHILQTSFIKEYRRKTANQSVVSTFYIKYFSHEPKSHRQPTNTRAQGLLVATWLLLSFIYFNTLRQMESDKKALIENNLFSLLMIYYNKNIYLCL